MKTFREFINEANEYHQVHSFGGYEYDDSNRFKSHKHAQEVADHLKKHGFESHVTTHNIHVGSRSVRKNTHVVSSKVKPSDNDKYVSALNSHPHVTKAYGKIEHRDLKHHQRDSYNEPF